jgi:hypothetical protein
MMPFVFVFSIEQLAPTTQPRFMHALFLQQKRTSDTPYCICQSPCLKNTQAADIPERIPCPATVASGVRPRQPSKNMTDGRGEKQRPESGAQPGSNPSSTERALPHSRLSLFSHALSCTRQNNHQSPVSPRANDTGATLNPTKKRLLRNLERLTATSPSPSCSPED